MTQAKETDPVALRQGLTKIRKCRWILWSVLLIYLPGMLIALELHSPQGTMATLFVGWVVILCIAVGLATVVRCPRCGKTYHTNGPTFLPVRQCVHCGLALNADKKL